MIYYISAFVESSMQFTALRRTLQKCSLTSILESGKEVASWPPTTSRLAVSQGTQFAASCEDLPPLRARCGGRRRNSSGSFNLTSTVSLPCACISPEWKHTPARWMPLARGGWRFSPATSHRGRETSSWSLQRLRRRWTTILITWWRKPNHVI